MRPANVACTFEVPPAPSVSAGIHPGSPAVGTWLDEWAGVFGPRGPPIRSAAPVSVLQCASRDDWRCAQSMHEFSAKDIDGRMVNLDKYRGFVCIVTNVASQ